MDFLKVSITDRCMCSVPEGFSDWKEGADVLTFPELLRVIRIAAQVGIRKVRVTGGEPLIRDGVIDFLARAARIPRIARVTLSTNGTLLAPLAGAIRIAGVRGVNVRLDALDSAIYRRITGGDLSPVLAGIDAAVDTGLPLKLNTVLIRGLNEQEAIPLLQFAAVKGVPLRFIELAPLRLASALDPARFIAAGEMRQRLEKLDELMPCDPPDDGSGPAQYFRMPRLGATVGFIGAMANLNSCEGCSKMRLTVDGKIRPCLGHPSEFDLKPALREIHSDLAIAAVFREAIQHKPAAHAFRENHAPGRVMTTIGG